MGLLGFSKRYQKTVKNEITFKSQVSNTAIVTKNKGILPIELPNPSELPAEVRAKAAERLAYVKLVDLTAQRRQCSARDAALYVATNHVHEFQILCRDGQKGASALHYNNYRNWRARCNNYGSDQALAALADNYRRGLQERRGDDQFWNYFFGFYLTLNNLPLTRAYKLAKDKIQKINKNVVIPSLAQARYQIEQIPADKIILAREGEVAYRNKCMDFIRRDWNDVAPGECVVGDTRDFDTRVRVWDDAKQRWVAVRPKIAGLLDARSWYLPAYWITCEPVNHATLIDTLALYCHNTGNQPPAICYFDNGKDYCAQGFATPFVTPDGAEHSIFNELNIRLLNSLAYNARAKTVERMFRDMMQQFDKLFPDYLGSRPGDRTPASDYFDTHADELPTLQQFSEIFARWLDEYHQTPKGGQIHRGKSPAELWRSRPERLAFSNDRLREAFYKPAAVRTVTRGPSVTLDRVWYYCDDLPFGEQVLVKTDHRDRERIMCYTLNGALIGEAVTRARIKALALDDADARAAIGEQMARQRRQLKEARTYINDLTEGRHLYSPLELFLADADAVAIKEGSIRLVKGATHNFQRRRLPVAELDQVETAPVAPQIEFYEDKDEAAMAKIHAIVTGTAAKNNQDLSDSEQLSKMKNIVKNRREDYEF